MIKIICKKVYDTENASVIKKCTYGCYGDPAGYEEILFQTPEGFYFVYGNGGANSPYPIDKKFEAFNFHVINVDGHDFDQLRAAFREARETKGVPTAIIMKTVKGKGVSFMENQVGWHGKAPDEEQYKIAIEDLERIGKAI